MAIAAIREVATTVVAIAGGELMEVVGGEVKAAVGVEGATAEWGEGATTVPSGEAAEGCLKPGGMAGTVGEGLSSDTMGCMMRTAWVL